MKNKKLLPMLFIGILLLSVPLAVYLAGQRQEVRKKAGGLAVTLGIYPASDSFSLNESKVFELKAVFNAGTASEKLDYLKTEVTFDKNYLKIPEGRYIDTSMSGFGKIFRVDGPSAANDTGKIVIELGALTPGGGPATDKPITVAKIYFQGLSQTSSTKNVTIGNTQVVNNQVSNLSLLSPQGLNYTVGPLSGGTPTPTPITGNPQTTATISDNFDGGSLDGSKWNTYSNNPQIATASAIKQENGVLRFTIPNGLTSFTGISADYKEKITGDFEASVDAKVEQGGDPYGSDTFILMHDVGWNNDIELFLRNVGGGNFDITAARKLNDQITVLGKATINISGPVTLQIKRIGSTVTYYYKTGNGIFNLITSSNDVFTGDGWLSLTVNTWMPNYPSVVSSFDNFSAKVNFLSAPTPTPAPCLTLPQSDNFNSGISSQMWNIWRSEMGGVSTADGNTLKASFPGGSNGYAGVITTGKVCGDFDVNVDFSQFTTSGQNEADVRLSIEEDVGNLTVVPSTVFIERFSQGNTSGFHAIKVIGGAETQFGSPVTNITSTNGKLRIRRVGSTYTLYYDIGGGWQAFNPANAFSGGAKIALIVKSWNQNPSISANFDNFNLTNAILDPSITPVPTNSPTPTPTPSPTPPSGREKYIIDVGDKQSLVIQIGPSINPQIKFKAKLASLRAYPEIYLKLRVKDELAFLDRQNNSTVSSDTCNNPTPPDRDFLIPMKATGEVYSPVQQISQPVPSGATVALVTPDGWVILDGMVPGRYYTLLLKGPKTRKSKMVEHFLLQPNQTSVQDFDWTGKPLDPGDLPDPANGNKQDCTINSADWSLEKARIGSNDGTNLAVCDVNYDGICNAGDSVAILDTLSKRPDDDF